MNPDNKVKVKLLKYEKTRGEDFEYQLKDGTKIQLKFDVNSIYRPIDESTGKPAVNSKTGEPVITINWGVRVNTIYSEKALSEFKVGSTTK